MEKDTVTVTYRHGKSVTVREFCEVLSCRLLDVPNMGKHARQHLEKLVRYLVPNDAEHGDEAKIASALQNTSGSEILVLERMDGGGEKRRGTERRRLLLLAKNVKPVPGGWPLCGQEEGIFLEFNASSVMENNVNTRHINTDFVASVILQRLVGRAAEVVSFGQCTS